MSNHTFVDFRAVKNKVTMVQILEHYGWMATMKAKHDGVYGPCPIHEGDNNNAFHVSISKNCWNCFGQCRTGGNVLDFVAKKERVPLWKAAQLLVKWFSLEIETIDPKAKKRRRRRSAQ